MNRTDRILAALALGFLAGFVVFCSGIGEDRARTWRIVNQESTGG